MKTVQKNIMLLSGRPRKKKERYVALCFIDYDCYTLHVCIQDLTAEEIKQIVETVNEKKHQEELSKYITSVHMKLLRYNVYCVLL